MEASELKPCPFTGQTPTEPIRQPNGQWRIWAGDYYRTCSTRKHVIAAWNTRAPDEQVKVGGSVEASEVWKRACVASIEHSCGNIDATAIIARLSAENEALVKKLNHAKDALAQANGCGFGRDEP